MRDDLRLVVLSFKTAHHVIWKHSAWKTLLVPLTISALLLLTIAGLSYLCSSLLWRVIEGGIEQFVNLPDWASLLVIIFFVIVGLAPVYLLFRSLVMVIYGPFLDRIAEKAEFLISGSNKDYKSSLVDSLKRPVMMLGYAVVGGVAISGVSSVLGLIPLVGVLLSISFLLPANIFMSSISYIDPYLERSGYSPRQSFDLMRKNIVSIFFFGVIGLLVTSIPFFGWFVGPTYSVVAGVALSILLHNKTI